MKTRILTTVMIALLGFLSFGLDAKPTKKTTKTGKTIVVHQPRGKGKKVVKKKKRGSKTVIIKKNRRGKSVIVKNNRQGHRHQAKRTLRHRRTCRR